MAEQNTVPLQRLTDDPKPTAVVMVGIIGSIVLLALIVGANALHDAMVAAEQETMIYGRGGIANEYHGLRNQQVTEINTYRWIDQENGVVGIPIEKAMETTARELEAAN